MKRVMFIGLGVMGYPMARHLQKKVSDLVVYNRTLDKSKKWAKEYNGNYVTTIAEGAQASDLIISCVSKDDDLEDVILNQALPVLNANAIIVDHSTVAAKTAQKISSLASKKQVHFIDAPISGGQKGAQEGKLTVMAGGDKDKLDSISDILKIYAKNITYFGKSGSGQYAKMANQIMIAGILQGMSEAINLAKKANLDIKTLVECLKNGSAQSWQLENRGLTMAENKFDFGFAVDLIHKDLNIALDAAETLNAELPLTALVNQFYKKLHLNGSGRLDSSSLITLLK